VTTVDEHAIQSRGGGPRELREGAPRFGGTKVTKENGRHHPRGTLPGQKGQSLDGPYGTLYVGYPLPSEGAQSLRPNGGIVQ